MEHEALEATVLWGDTILDQVHLWRDRSLRLGELRAEIDASPERVIAKKRGTRVTVRIPGGRIVELGAGEMVSFSLGNLLLREGAPGGSEPEREDQHAVHDRADRRGRRGRSARELDG